MMKLTCARIFSDNMVLQRDREIPVHGTGTPGAKVTVELNGATAAAFVAKDGKWLAMLPAMDKRGNLTLTVKSGEETIAFHNVVLGEVWLAGGQSNMEFEMYKANVNQVAIDKREPEVQFGNNHEVLEYILCKKYTSHISLASIYRALCTLF